MSITYVTDNFSWQEFACHSGEAVPDAWKANVRALCETVLEPIRARFGAPLVVISGWRSKTWNDRVGGAKGSQHLTGRAADVRPVSLANVPALMTLVEEMIRNGQLPRLGGFGVYRGWIHCDTRPRIGDHVARWQGKGVGSEAE